MEFIYYNLEFTLGLRKPTEKKQHGANFASIRRIGKGCKGIKLLFESHVKVNGLCGKKNSAASVKIICLLQ